MSRDTIVKNRLKLGNGRVPQAFAVDATQGYIYTLQLKAESTADLRGDLLVTRLRLRDGKKLDTMTLRGFGHGIALGCIPAPESTQKPPGSWLWIETGPVKLVKGGSGISARGTRVTKLMYTPGRTVTCKAGKITAVNASGKAPAAFTAKTLEPVKGKPVAVSVDATARLLAHKDGGTYRIYQLDEKGNPSPKPVATTSTTQAGTFQGFCISGDNIWILRGEPKRRPTITRHNWRTGDTVTWLTDATLKRRGYFEAEGISVVDGKVWWGLSTGLPGARRLTIFNFDTGSTATLPNH